MTRYDPRRWPSYATLWRWHFYAGLFCIPFVLWLAIDRLDLPVPPADRGTDRPSLRPSRRGRPPRFSRGEQAAAAVRAVPGSVLHRYQLPDPPDEAVQVIVGRGAERNTRLCSPADACDAEAVDEDERLMRIVFRLHGELSTGNAGSYLVELAASWAIVMILSGAVPVVAARRRAGRRALSAAAIGRAALLARPARRHRLLGVGFRAVPASLGTALGKELGRLSENHPYRRGRADGPAGLVRQPAPTS